MYLVAVIDWYSRYVLPWRLSNTLDGYFCLACLQDALQTGKPTVFNTDQGVQFTTKTFTSCLEDAEISVSMDGKGRALDNIFVERAQWAPGRTVKYEDIYLKDYSSGLALERGLTDYFRFYGIVAKAALFRRFRLIWAKSHSGRKFLVCYFCRNAFYDFERPHQSLGDRTPAEVYFAA